MFERLHHQRVAVVLSMLVVPPLVEHDCWFGGGTAIVLANGEYRESDDVDFLVGPAVLPKAAPYRQGPWARRSGAIKLEIIHESRIDLDTPTSTDEICGVRILTRTDQVASKLLANHDRWADTSTFSRDLIDLAMTGPGTAALTAGAHKAVDAYRKTVAESLDNAVTNLRERPHRLDECIRALRVTLLVSQSSSQGVDCHVLSRIVPDR